MKTNMRSVFVSSAAAVGLAAIATLGMGVASASAAEVDTSGGHNQGVIQIHGGQAGMPMGLQSLK